MNNNWMNWINQDITFCMNDKCPIKEYCFRAIGCTERIATYSDFNSVCNFSNVFKYFIQAPMDLVEQKRQQKKEG